MPMSEGRSKRLSSFFAFLRPRKGKGKSDAGSVSLRSRAATPSPPSVAEKTEKSPTSPTSPSTASLVSPIYDASQTKANMANMANMSRMSGLNEVDVASFPLPPSLPPTKDKVVTRSESTPVFSHLDLDLTLSNPASPISPISTRASTSTLSKQSGFLRRASSAGLRVQSPKSRPQSFLPPAPIPQIDLKFDVGRMDVDFAPPKPAQSRSTTTL